MGYKVNKRCVGTKQIWPYIDTRTFTISWTEKSDMSSGWTYSDDAAGLTAGDTAFDEFFGYSLTKVSTAGVVTEEVTQAQSGGAGKLDFTQLSSTSSGDNVMIKFPKRGIKMTKSGSTVTLSITADPDRAADGFNYYAFQSGDINNITATYDQFFMGAFKAVDGGSSTSKSWSGKAPLTNQTQANACAYAKKNNTSLLWNIVNPYMRWQLCAYAIMKWGNPNVQSVIGNGVVSGSKTNTGTLLSINNKDATYGTTANSTTQVRLFGVEDFWGNVHDWIGGMYANSSKVLYTQLSGYSGAISGGASTGVTIQHNTGSKYCLSSIAGNNKAMFAPVATVSNSSYNTYYCDFAVVVAGHLAIAGASRSDRTYAGLFDLHVNWSTSNTNDAVGSRLALLK